MNYILTYGDELCHSGRKGMKWYQHIYGEFQAGAKYAKENKGKLLEQNIKNGKDKANISPAEKVLKDTNRIFDNTGTLVDQVHTSLHPKKRRDLSSYTDQELRALINRATMENQYNNILDAAETHRGYEITKDILSTTGSIVGIAASTVGIAATIYNLKHKKD